MYEYQQVYDKCLKYFDQDELATSSLLNKYLLKDKEGNFLEDCPEKLFNRLTDEFYRIEQNYDNSLTREQIYDVLKDFKYVIPGGSGLYGIGNNVQITSIANCFVLDSPNDNYSSIVNKDKELVQIMKRRGGVGIDLSTIRPAGSTINNAAKSSNGVTCFMERYSNTTKEVAQNGRRGALMQTIDCRHPDLEAFIKIKQDLTKVTGANISVKWHNDFLEAVENNQSYLLRFPVDVRPEQATYIKEVNAREIWNMFVESNWNSAEPGCLYWDTITNNSLSDCYPDFQTISTNPCGEITLSPYGSCILMAINLTGFVENQFTNQAKFNFEKFKDVIFTASKMIDDMVDLEIEKVNKIIDKIKNDPDSEDDKRDEIKLWETIKLNYQNGRRVGLGILGFGDMIAMLNMTYDSDQAISIAEDVFKNFHQNVMESQAIISEQRGPFKVFDWEKESGNFYYNDIDQSIIERIKKTGRRNISITTIAPTGTIAMLAQVSSGIEPIFMRSYNRRRKLNGEEIDKGVTPDHVDDEGINWIHYQVFHHKLNEWKQLHLGESVDQSPYWGSEAGELDWRVRVKLQSIAQKYITHSISSTCNLHKQITQEEIGQIYLQAWKQGCKGITIYRDGSRDGILFSDEEDKENNIIESHAPKRPKVLPCDIHYSTIEGNPWIFFVGHLNDAPYEILGGKRSHIEIPKKYKTGWIKKNGKVNGRRKYDLVLGSLDNDEEQTMIKDIGHNFSVDKSSFTRNISMSLRHGVPIKIICEQLHKDGESDIFSFAKGVARVLKKYIRDGESATGECPGCGDQLKYKDGCVCCMSCGWSKCS